MAPCHASLRRKLYQRLRSGALPQHGHCLEYFFVIVNLAVSVAYVYGSWTFLYEDLTSQGAWIFIVGSYTIFAIQLCHIVEERHYMKHVLCAGKRDPVAARHANAELMEHINYAIAAFLFAGGSFFYMPGMPGDVFIKSSLGSALFIAGSFSFVLASFFNSLGLAANKDNSKFTDVYVTCHYLYVTALMCSQCGSIMFFAGSVLYRPELSNSCSSATCTSPTTLGTYFYILGSCLYLVEATSCFLTSALKHTFGDDQVKARDASLTIAVLERVEAMLCSGTQELS